MQFTTEEFVKLSGYAFSKDNKGYRPNVFEAPNGDGVFDLHKRFAHIAPKYGVGAARHAYALAFHEAECAAKMLGLDCPISFDSTLRVLEYPPGGTSARHTDFCLFTLSLFRTHPDAFKYVDESPECTASALRVRKRFPRIHFGELMTEIDGTPATSHEVIATRDTQHAVLFFAMPPLGMKLPSGLTVKEWLDERKGRSRRWQRVTGEV